MKGKEGKRTGRRKIKILNGREKKNRGWVVKGKSRCGRSQMIEGDEERTLRKLKRRNGGFLNSFGEK